MRAFGFAVLAALPLMGSIAAHAQPARIGNVWDGQRHEPTPGVVNSEEKSAGVAPPAAQQNQQADQLQQQSNQLIDKTKRETGAP